MMDRPDFNMDSDEFRQHGKDMVDFVADYWDGIRERKPGPVVDPMYIKKLLPVEAPQDPEDWQKIMDDLEPVVVNGSTHWQHPHFFAYFPTACSYPAIIGDILSGGLSAIGFTWNSSPACTELEMVVIDWLAKMIQLPEHFLNSHPGPGAGMIQCTASDCTLIALLSARNKTLKKQKELEANWDSYLKSMPKKAITRFSKWWAGAEQPDGNEYRQMGNLIAYTSIQSHSSVERAALLAAIKMRGLPTYSEDDYALTGATLEAAIIKDIEAGNTPFFVCATVGTTNVCAFDRLEEIGKVAQKYGLWMHIDSAYAGSAAICPEYRKLLNGVEYADTFNFNAHKWLFVNFDCAPMWFKDVSDVEQAFLVDAVYLKHDHDMPDFKNWQIPLGRRFRSLKLWFVLRTFGVKKLQQHIRYHCRLAQEFADLIASDKRFEMVTPVKLGLVSFRLKGENGLTERLNGGLKKDQRIHLVPGSINGIYYLRLSICSEKTTSDDVIFAFNVIEEVTDKLEAEF